MQRSPKCMGKYIFSVHFTTQDKVLARPTGCLDPDNIIVYYVYICTQHGLLVEKGRSPSVNLLISYVSLFKTLHYSASFVYRFLVRTCFILTYDMLNKGCVTSGRPTL